MLLHNISSEHRKCSQRENTVIINNLQIRGQKKTVQQQANCWFEVLTD